MHIFDLLISVARLFVTSILNLFFFMCLVVGPCIWFFMVVASQTWNE